MKILRKILLPFSWIYAFILHLRNKAYDKNWLKSTAFQLPVIAVGNLSMGGTGKSPAIEYLVRLLNNTYKVASLSRGYGRKTSGFKMVHTEDIAEEVGDEPLQFKNKFPKIDVAVDEKRVNGIQQLIELKNPDVILLDDAFQHRQVKPGFQILLSTYKDLYADDFVLPAGNLREPKSRAKRADVIIITKCPENLSVEAQNKIKNKLKLLAHQQLFFAYIAYQKKAISLQDSKSLHELQNYSLVTGIANPTSLVDHLEKINAPKKHFKFKDHHNFTKDEIETLNKEDLILTTEKDFTRLKDNLPAGKLYYIPIEMKLIANEETFNQSILDFVSKNLAFKAH